MITFQEYLKEMSIVQPGQSASGAVSSVASAALNLAADVSGVGTALNLSSAFLKGASALKKAWFERASVKQAIEISKKNMLSKAQNRDPSLVDRTVASYFDVSDQTLQYLSDQEKENISQQVMNAVSRGQVSPGFSQNIANQILQNKAQSIAQAIQNSQPRTLVT